MTKKTDPLKTRLFHAWNVFTGRQAVLSDASLFGQQTSFSSVNPGRRRLSSGVDRSIITSALNRMAMDVASFKFFHVQTDSNGRYLHDIKSGFGTCLSLEANKDQTSSAFFQDLILSMFDEGSVAIVPVDTKVPPNPSGAYDILSLRTGRIIEWFPDAVRIELYNDRDGRLDRVLLPKSIVGIVENPLYAIMNEPNGTISRLRQKLNLLDYIDEQRGSGKLDIIIQLPYVVKTATKQAQADKRREALEAQLAESKFGIAYTDATEKVTQLNRPAESKLLEQVTYLTNMLYSQLGITEAVFNGTASEVAMLNYFNRTIEPMTSAIVNEMRRKFLTSTARTQGQDVMAFRDVFDLVPANEIAEMADSLSRNEIVSPNEFRAFLRMAPSGNPKSDELSNSNMPIEKKEPKSEKA